MQTTSQQLAISRTTTHEVNIDTVTLCHPERLNALNADMFEQHSHYLHDIPTDTHGWILEGAGHKALCSGADIKSLIESECFAVTAANTFSHSYRIMDWLERIETPSVALMHGIVMGGGVGMAHRCHHRVAFTDMRWAMPEVHIGLFPDVGMTRHLHHCKNPVLGAFLAMTGWMINAHEALALGLVDVVVNVDDREVLRDALQTTSPEKWGAVIDSYRIDVTGNTPLIDHQADIEAIMAQTTLPERVVAIHAHGENHNAWWQQVSQQFTRTCPASMMIADWQMRHADQLSNLDALRGEYTLMCQLAEVDDSNFRRGVRAVMIDKRPAVWQPRTCAEVDVLALEHWVAEGYAKPRGFVGE